MHYLISIFYIILPFVLLMPNISAADPWLPGEGKYKFCSSLYISSDKSYRSLNNESKTYYDMDLLIYRLNKIRDFYQNDPRLTSEAKIHRLQDIDQNIEQVKLAQSKSIKYHPRRIFSEMIEYGISDKHSAGLVLIHGPEKNYRGRKRSFTGMQIFQKTRLYSTRKRILSIQPSLTIYQREDDKEGEEYVELRFLGGKVTKSKIGKVFHNIEIAPGWSKNALSFNLDYTIGLETKRNIIFMFQSFNFFEPRGTKIYNQRVISQISVAKPFFVDSVSGAKKITLQVGYFHEHSISAKRSINEGMLASLWLEI